MKGIIVKKYGGPEVCEYDTNLPIPEPKDDEVQIRVHAAGVNPIDAAIRAGHFGGKVPYTPGLDSAGVVTKVGKNVTKLKIGDRAYTTMTVSGAYAEYTVAKAVHTFKLDDNLSFEEGSGIGVPYFTAYRGLYTKAQSKPGEVVLVHGASGAVGLAAVQLAHIHGMTVIGTAGTPDGMDLVKQQGADYVFNHRENGYIDKIKALFPEGVDVVLEMVASVNLVNDLSITRKTSGRVVVIGNKGETNFNPGSLLFKESQIYGLTLYAATDDELKQSSSYVNALFRSKSIKPVLGRKYNLSQANKATDDILNNNGTLGRLTLLVD